MRSAGIAKPVNSDELKQAPQFVHVSQEDWTLATDALFQMGYIQGRDIRTGHQNTLQGVLRCVKGQENIRPVITWKSFYRKWLNYFGREFFQKRRGKLTAATVGAVALFFAGYSPGAWMNWEHTAIGTLLGVGAWTLVDFVRAPWLIQNEPVGQEQPSHGGFTVLGATVVVAMIVGLVYLSSPFWMPKRHRHAIPLNNEYANLTNTQHTFKSLSVQLPNCVLRITAPPENRHVVEVLRNVAGDFCKLEAQPDSNNAEIDMVSGSEADAVLVHLTKPVSPKDEIRDGVLGELQNILSIRFKHDMPAGSPPELIWLQVGHGYPWAKD